MKRVAAVGFEAELPFEIHRSLVNWAAAALSEGGKLLNPRTGSRSPLSDLQVLHQEGYLTKLPEPIPLNVTEPCPAIVCVFRRDPLMEAVRGKEPLDTVGSRTDPWFIYDVFLNDDTFKRYASTRAQAIFQALQAKKSLSASEALLLQSGKVLAPFSGVLLALQTHFGLFGERSIDDQMAQAMLRNRPDELEEYRRACLSLQV